MEPFIRGWGRCLSNLFYFIYLMIYEFLDSRPVFGETVFIAPRADIIGDVTIGEHNSVWFNVTVRCDVKWISMGGRTNTQDKASVQVTPPPHPPRSGNDVTIGHTARVHGCTLHDRVLVGIHATILDGAVVHSDVIIAAGSLVPPGKVLDSGYLYMGSPARKIRELSEEEIRSVRQNAANYVKYQRAYRREDTYKENPFYKRKK